MCVSVRRSIPSVNPLVLIYRLQRRKRDASAHARTSGQKLRCNPKPITNVFPPIPGAPCQRQSDRLRTRLRSLTHTPTPYDWIGACGAQFHVPSLRFVCAYVGMHCHFYRFCFSWFVGLMRELKCIRMLVLNNE